MILRDRIFATLEYPMPHTSINTTVKSTVQHICFNSQSGADRVENALQKTVVAALEFDIATIHIVQTML